MDNIGSISIRDILNQVASGQIRIPAFQRGFVWDPSRVAYLMDSIYKRYPVGSLLIWRTKERLKTERNLGPFQLPQPKEDYPVDYVLDGQQRITSIFGVFQTDLTASESADWTNVYLDLQAGNDAQESQVVALLASEAVEKRHFPLGAFFDSTAYRALSIDIEVTSQTSSDEAKQCWKPMSASADSHDREWRDLPA